MLLETQVSLHFNISFLHIIHIFLNYIYVCLHLTSFSVNESLPSLNMFFKLREMHQVCRAVTMTGFQSTADF